MMNMNFDFISFKVKVEIILVFYTERHVDRLNLPHMMNFFGMSWLKIIDTYPKLSKRRN